MVLTSLSFTVECDECHARVSEFASVQSALVWMAGRNWVLLPSDGTVLCDKCAHGDNDAR